MASSRQLHVSIIHLCSLGSFYSIIVCDKAMNKNKPHMLTTL